MDNEIAVSQTQIAAMSKPNFTVYRASAGSGKTFTLALNYIAQLLKNPQNAHRRISAVSFTNAAANEMKERILHELCGLADGKKGVFFEELTKVIPEFGEERIFLNAKTALHSILHDYSNFKVYTIDVFLQKVLRNLTRELGINSNFDIELDTETPIKEAVKALINEALSVDIINFVEHKLENDKWSIEKDLQEFAQNIFKENFQKKESEINKELKQNPQKIDKSIAECKNIVKKYEEDISTAPNDQISELQLKEYNSAQSFLKFIHQLRILSDISNKISEQNKEKNRFILANTNQVLSSFMNRETAFIFEKICADIQSIVVDEFQDTSELQWKIFKKLIGDAVLSQNNFGMLVGDVRQSIYRWRNGNWKILYNIEKELGEQCDYKSLDTNFRSAKNIVEFNNNLFSTAQKKKRNKDGYVSVDFTDAVKNGRETLKKYNDVVVEKIAGKIKLLLEKGVKQSEICILCRTNSQIKKIANDLPAILPNVKIISEEAYMLGSSKEVQMLISALQIIAQPQNPVPRAKLCADWGKLTVEQLTKEKCEEETKFLNAQFLSLPFYDLLVKLSEVFEFSKTAPNNAFLFAFMDKIMEYSAKNKTDINRFLEFWNEKLSRETVMLPTKDDKRDGVLLMTVHKSKGLQFHTVIVAFCDWLMAPNSGNLLWCDSSEKAPPFNFALLPVEYNSKMQESVFEDEYLEESQNLKVDNMNVLYVALTRAEDNLVVIAKTPSKTGGDSVQKLLRDYVKTDNFEMGEL